MSVSLRERLLPTEFTRGDLAPPPRTLLDILDATARRYPDAPAIDDGDATVTYAELMVRVAEGARRLASGGVRAGDRVGIRMPSGSRELYLAILSTLAAGAAYVPVDPEVKMIQASSSGVGTHTSAGTD